MSRRPAEREAWVVSFPAHRVGGRYDVPATSFTRFDRDRELAVEVAAVQVQVRAGVPPWRPWLRETIALASVERKRAVASAGGSA